jgi:phage antirepressor YoqD-like protein
MGCARKLPNFLIRHRKRLKEEQQLLAKSLSQPKDDIVHKIINSDLLILFPLIIMLRLYLYVKNMIHLNLIFLFTILSLFKLPFYFFFSFFFSLNVSYKTSEKRKYKKRNKTLLNYFKVNTGSSINYQVSNGKYITMMMSSKQTNSFLSTQFLLFKLQNNSLNDHIDIILN